jgi:hypothetical protein
VQILGFPVLPQARSVGPEMTIRHNITISSRDTSVRVGKVTLQWYCRLCLRLRAALLYVGLHSFTTCFELHGHLQVCRIPHIFYFHISRDSCSLLFWFAACFYSVTLRMFFICRVGKVVIWGIIICCLCYFLFCYMCVFLLVFCSCAVFLVFYFFVFYCLCVCQYFV